MKSNKIAIITDLHFGVRKDDPFYLKKQDAWLQSLKQTMSEQGIKTLYNLGDTFDNRLYVNVNTMNFVFQSFFMWLEKNEISSIHLIGNHDAYYRDTNQINSVEPLTKNLKYSSVISDGIWAEGDFVFCPWITKSNQSFIMAELDRITDKKNKYLLGHFEIAGCPMQGGNLCEHGLPIAYFKEWKRVLSGHFHNPSVTSNIHYIGNPFFTTWSDYNQDKGYYVYDPDTDVFTHIPTPDKVYHIIKEQELDSIDISSFNEQIIKLYISNTDENKDKLNQILKTLNAHNNRVEVVDTSINKPDDVMSSALAPEISMKHVESKDFLNDMVDSLYTGNQTTEVKSYLDNLFTSATNYTNNKRED